MKLITTIGLLSTTATSATAVATNVNTEKDSTLEQLKYFVSHKQELDNIVIPKFDELASRAKASIVIKDWISNLDDSFLDVQKGVLSIDGLSIDKDLKMFVLQNYLDKISINVQKSILDRETERTRKDASVFSQKPGSNFILSNVVVTKSLPSWDLGEHKGMIDPISGKFFPEILAQTSPRGWDNGDADSEWSANKVDFEFTDKISGEKQSFSLYYNAAKDTDYENEDYTFVAIMPGKKADGSLNTFITEDNKVVPAIFGVPLDFRKMPNLEALKRRLHIDAPYFASSHTHDAGSDSDWGNYLDGIVLNGQTYNLSQRDGTASIYHVAKNVLEYVDNELNDEFTHTLNPNYLYDPFSKDPSYAALGNYRIPKSGVDGTTNDHHAFANDNTYISWSNQTILNYVLSNVISEISGATKEFEALKLDPNALKLGNVSATAIDGIRKFTNQMDNIQKNAIKFGIVKPVGGWPTLSNIFKFTKNSGIAIALSLLTTDWTSPESIADNAVSLGGGMLLSAISDAASTALVEAGTSLLSSLAGEAGITVGEGLLGVEAGAIAGPIGIVAGTVATALLQFIPTANEHSVMSNFGDHGLNDWDYQLKHNQQSLISTAYNFSYNYTKGITWDVEDGWFSLPDLWIKTQGDGYGWKNLSPNSEFNNGNLVPESRP